MSAVFKEDVFFRSMEEMDVDEIMDLEKKGHAYPWTLGIFRDCLRVGYACEVMEQDNLIRAYGVMSVAAGEAHIFNVCVAPEKRRKGYGRMMMERLVEIAKSRGAKSMFLEVRPSNLSALMLYEKMGFNEVGIRKDYYPAKVGREDALILAMNLEDQPSGE